MDYAAFQYQHHVPGEIVQLGTLEDAVSDYFVVQSFRKGKSDGVLPIHQNIAIRNSP